HALTAEMSFFKKVGAFARMFREKGISSAEPELKTLEKRLESVNQQRNELIHAAWSVQGMRMKFKRIKGKGPRYEIVPMPAKRIEEIRDQIGEAGALLWHFAMKYIQNPEPKE